MKIIKKALNHLLLWGNTLLGAFLVLGIFIFIEIISFNHNHHMDLTPDKVYSLSRQTKNVLDSLVGRVYIKTFYKMGEGSDFEDFFGLLSSHTPKVKYELIDIDRNPGKARIHNVSSSGHTIIEYLGKTKYIFFPNEETVVNTILLLAQDEQKFFYVLKGHGERQDIKTLKLALTNQNWEVEAIYMPEVDEILKGKRTVLMIANPEKDLNMEELPILDRYLKKGGKAIILLEPFTEIPNLKSALKTYGIQLPESIIIDFENKLFGGDYLAPLIPHYAETPITSQIGLSSVFPTARPVDIKRSSDLKGIKIMSLAHSAKHSWTKTEQEEIIKGNVDFHEGLDRPGPVPVVARVIISGMNGNSQSGYGELVCFGDSDFINDTFFDLMGNKDLFLNSAEWLAREHRLISIRKSKFNFPYHHLSASQGRFLFLISVVTLPSIFLILGVIIFSYRRIRG